MLFVMTARDAQQPGCVYCWYTPVHDSKRKRRGRAGWKRGGAARPERRVQRRGNERLPVLHHSQGVPQSAGGLRHRPHVSFLLASLLPPQKMCVCVAECNTGKLLRGEIKHIVKICERKDAWELEVPKMDFGEDDKEYGTETVKEKKQWKIERKGDGLDIKEI